MNDGWLNRANQGIFWQMNQGEAEDQRFQLFESAGRRMSFGSA